MEPVEIKEDDSEEDKRIKQEVEATKHELAARLKAGEDIGAVLEETREELRRMAAYKESVMETARDEIMKNATSTADVDAYHEAMNKMLESKGLAPVKMSGLMRRKIKYDLMKAAEKEAAATKGETK